MDIVSRVAGCETFEESRDVESGRNGHYESSTSIESQMADGMLN